MKGPAKPQVTVILEDAYKQNTVYRPWKDITSGQKTGKHTLPPDKSVDARHGHVAPR